MYPILEKRLLAEGIWLMKVLAPRVARSAQPGQFVIVRADEHGERIPLTISDFDAAEGSVTIVTQAIGASTRKICALNEGIALVQCAETVRNHGAITNIVYRQSEVLSVSNRRMSDAKNSSSIMRGRTMICQEVYTMRLTKDVRQKLLEQNEGFQRTTYYESNNSYNTNTYMISNGQLTVRSNGDTSWSDSKYDETRICDDAQTHRFLRKNLSDLNTDGID